MPRWPRKPRLYYGLFGGAAIAVTSAVVTYKEVQGLGSSPWPSHPMFHPARKTYTSSDEKRRYWWRLKRDVVLRFPWLHAASHDPDTLLLLAGAHDPHIRWRAVQALADKHPWTDAEYRYVAAALDDRTLVALARIPHADPRLFLPQPAPQLAQESVEDELRDLLERLPKDDVDMCTLYFTASALKERRDSEVEKDSKLSVWTFDGTDMLMEREMSPGSSGEQSKQQSTLRLHMLGLQVLLGYSKVPATCECIACAAGLSCLQHVMSARPHNMLIQRRVARVLANLTTIPHAQHHIIRTGWVTVLNTWLRSRDLALSSLASKALANLDTEAHVTYLDGVHLYHPQYRDSKPVHADVVFVHGLLGGPFRTWRQQDPPKKDKKETKKDTVGAAGSDSWVSRFYGKNGKKKDEQKNDLQDKDSSRSALNDSNTATDSKQPSINDSGESLTVNIAEKDVRKEEQDVNARQDSQDKSPNTQSENNSSRNTTNNDSRNTEPSNSLTVPADSEKNAPSGFHHEPYTFCWPKDWLAQEIPRARILTVEYETQLSEWAPTCPHDSDKRLLKSRAIEMLGKLRAAGVGDRPIVWVGHSMGGLLIKQILCLAERDAEYQSLVDNTEGMVFYSVPHRGSPLVTYNKLNKYVFFPSVEVRELSQDSPMLLSLHRDFTELMLRRCIPLLSFTEGQKTNLPLNIKLLMVPRQSSDPGFGTHYILQERNHLNICKPASPAAPVYRLTRHFINECLAAAATYVTDPDTSPRHCTRHVPYGCIFCDWIEW